MQIIGLIQYRKLQNFSSIQYRVIALINYQKDVISPIEKGKLNIEREKRCYEKNKLKPNQIAFDQHCSPTLIYSLEEEYTQLNLLLLEWLV